MADKPSDASHSTGKAAIPSEYSGTSANPFSPHDSALSLAETVHNPAIEEEDAPGFTDEEPLDDNDSAFGGSLLDCDTDTLASYITDYRYENGRRYHAYQDGEYWGPNDDHANDLQDLAHHMYLMTLEGKLHLAPLSNPQAILDLGTGTGIWAMSMADTYPSAKVVGTELSPIQPQFVPPNCQFEIEDFNLEWTYPHNHFDFVHIRELFGCVVNWDTFFRSCYEVTKPGGWVEILEHSVWPVADDDTVNEESFFTLWGQTVEGLGEKFGKTFKIWKQSKEKLENAGFVDVHEVRYKWPMNEWPSPKCRTKGDDGDLSWKLLRELGQWNQYRLYAGVEGFMIRLLTQVGGWTYEAAQLFLAQMRIAIKDTKVHGYLDVTVVYGRKPAARTDPSPSGSPSMTPVTPISSATPMHTTSTQNPTPNPAPASDPIPAPVSAPAAPFPVQAAAPSPAVESAGNPGPETPQTTEESMTL